MPDWIVNGSEIEDTAGKKTQVYQATHMTTDGGTWKRSPIMKRSFISFMYGGKKIEDFNLIAVISDNMMTKNLYADFEDITTTYDVLDGQFYWGTRMSTNHLDFTLATDEITEEQLNDFVNWFKPGIDRELVLAEHPNRAIMARVAAPPQYRVIPFEQKQVFKIDGLKYNTSTTVYRGEISLSFIMDEPYWYARNNFIDYYYKDSEDKFGTMTGTYNENYINVWDDPDTTKVIIEDHVPQLDMFASSGILLGDKGLTVDLNHSIVSSAETVLDINGVAVMQVETSENVENPKGRIGVVTANNGITLGDGENGSVGYLFYSGTAPCRPIIEFTLNPIMNITYPKNHYILYPLNSYSELELSKKPEHQYNTLHIGEAELKFSLPSLYLGFNEAKKIVQSNDGVQGDILRELLRDNVHDYYARTWALACLTGLDNTTVGFDGFSTRMNYFIMDDEGMSYSHTTFTFNSKTGRCTAAITIRFPNDNISFNSRGAPVANTSKIITVEEDSGDIMRSGYPIIGQNQRCNFDDTNHIRKAQCLKVWTDYPGPTDYLTQDSLMNITIEFKNMYL